MGVSHRTIQRSLQRLLKNGFMTKMKKEGRKDPQRYDMTPLVEMLKPFAERALTVTQTRSYDNVLDDTFVKALMSATNSSISNIYEVSVKDTPF